MNDGMGLQVLIEKVEPTVDERAWDIMKALIWFLAAERKLAEFMLPSNQSIRIEGSEDIARALTVDYENAKADLAAAFAALVKETP